jgi:hypothetical protein
MSIAFLEAGKARNPGWIRGSCLDVSNIKERASMDNENSSSDGVGRQEQSRSSAQAWSDRAEDLTNWVWALLVVRTDAWISYYVDEGRIAKATKRGTLDRERIIRHFRATGTEGIISLLSAVREIGEDYSVARDTVIDIDCHDAKRGDHTSVLKAAIGWREAAVKLGFHPILEQSSISSYHLRIIYNQEVAASEARAFGLWLTRDWKDRRLVGPPEIFPVQDNLSEQGSKHLSFGGGVRIFGRNPSHGVYSAIYDGKDWLEDDDAIDFILGVCGDDPSRVPLEARRWGEKRPDRTWEPQEFSAEELADEVEEAKRALDCLGKVKEIVDDRRTWIVIGMALRNLGAAGLPLWIEWSRKSDKFQEGECERAYEGFRPAVSREDVSLATLFFMAGQHGYKPKRPKRAARKEATGTYSIQNGVICRGFRAGPATVWEPLGNFSAEIVEAIVCDDGEELSKSLLIKGELQDGTPLSRVEVNMAEFASCEWVAKHWADEYAVLRAGAGVKDHLRAAVQLLSGKFPRRRVYGHLGWRKIEGTWVYLHGGPPGAIGVPPGSTIDVALPESLANFALPLPPQGEELVTAVKTSLGLFDGLAPDRAMMPAYSLLLRAVLPGSTISGCFVGSSGERKTELASLIQRHFGATMHSRNLPANWYSTANSIEGILFCAKDAVVVVDDFCPRGNRGDIDRYHKNVEQVFRSIANHSARNRMRADTSLRPPKPPRGIVISTAEDFPRGVSLLARVVLIEIGKGVVNLDRLTRCQQAAESGIYAQALAGYLAWLAPRIDEAVVWLKDQTIPRRGQIASKIHRDSHPQTATITAELLLATELFLRFALEIGAVTGDALGELRRRWTEALVANASAQREFQTQADPARLYLDLIKAILVSGRGHLAAPGGGEPANPLIWGWKSESVRGPGGEPALVYRACGRCIGWVDQDNIYLHPTAAYAEVQALAQTEGESFATSRVKLHKLLHEDGWLQSTERDGRLTVRRTICSEEIHVLHLATKGLSSAQEPDEPDESHETPRSEEPCARNFAPEVLPIFREPDKADAPDETPQNLCVFEEKSSSTFSAASQKWTEKVDELHFSDGAEDGKAEASRTLRDELEEYEEKRPRHDP